MSQFKSKAMKWKPDFIGRLLVGVLVGKGEVDLEEKLKERETGVLVAFVFVQNADIE